MLQLISHPSDDDENADVEGVGDPGGGSKGGCGHKASLKEATIPV